MPSTDVGALRSSALESLGSQTSLATEQFHPSCLVFFLILFFRNQMVLLCKDVQKRCVYCVLNRTLFPDELSRSLRQRLGAVSPPALPQEKVPGVCLPAQALEEPASQRGFSSQLGLAELGAGGEPRHTLLCSLEPSLTGARKGFCCFPSGPGPDKVQGPSGSQKLGGPTLIFKSFLPNQAHLGQSEAQHLIDCPHLLLKATSIPFPHPLGLPASRLQNSDLPKSEKAASQHLFQFGFANRALCLCPTLPASFHFSPFLPYSLS